MIVGTAGHIDHGKTALVRALTGVDTDRLPEEKRRGISIELGYAFMPVPHGAPIGFVDVPGHDRLVHTMLAGATGMDAVLLVVAVDDGVMPQTREHMAIVSLLGIERGAIVLTKCDRAAPARIGQVRAEVADLVQATPYATAPVFETAAVTGAGLAPLRLWLTEQAGCSGRDAVGTRAFRLAVDRVFTLPGVGTVVTGTVMAGKVGVSASVQVVPSGRAARVRSIHAQNRQADTAHAGDRCALNLAGVDRGEIERGQWICDPQAAVASGRIDVRVSVWPGRPAPLRSGQDVHLHLGAADIVARVVLLEADPLPAGARGYAQLALRRPTGAWHGDRFVLRDAPARQTIAGGVVLDPQAPARYRKSAARMAQLAALETVDARQRAEALLQASAFGVPVQATRRLWGLTSVDELFACGAVRLGQGDSAFVLAPVHWGGLQQRMLEVLKQQCAQEPDCVGIEVGRFKRMAAPRVDPVVAEAAIEALVAQRHAARSGAFVQLAAQAARRSEQECRLAQRIVPLIEAGGFDPPWVRDIARDLKQPEALVRAVLAHQAQRGAVFQVVKDWYLHGGAVEQLAATAREIHRRDGAVRAAAFRDATGLGRKRAIQMLEFFDRIGLLRRVRDVHLVRPGTRLFSQASAST